MTCASGGRRWLGLFSGGATLLLVTSAFAEASPVEKSAAEALFQKGVELMAADKAPQACEKFEGSNQLEPALGTMLRLADCYERIGKTASAWVLFQQVAATASQQGQSVRYRIADERVRSLQQRLSRLQLAVDARVDKTGLQVKLNGKTIPAATLGVALPVDPGPHSIEVSSPGFFTWRATVKVEPGGVTAHVEVPALERDSRAEAPRAPLHAVAPTPPQRGRKQPVIGYVVGGFGAAGLAVGGIFASLAYYKNRQSLYECRKSDVTACTPRGVDLRKDAQSAATLATVAGIAGSTLLVTGVTLLLSASAQEEHAQGSAGVRAAATLYPGGVLLRGEFW